MNLKRLFGVVLILMWCARAFAEETPHIGYAYPAGGERGRAFRVMIGGQHLASATNVLVSGEGVEVDIVKYTVKYDPKQYRRLHKNIKNAEAALDTATGKQLEKLKKRIAVAEKKLAQAELPEGVSADGKGYKKQLKNTKEQFNPQISERLRVDVKISPNAPPGERELRVYTDAGLSNPIYFEVGTLDEVRETEPNDDHHGESVQEIAIPAVINGQIRPGDIDHFRFRARQGQSLVIDVGARKIIPYLADAVPGWFQAVVALYDEEGNEVAYQDDYKFNPDPVLFFEVPRTGTYFLSIKDSIYRGREDFIYRIAIGELPFITSIFPLGAAQGENIDIALTGHNLPKERISGRLPADGREVRHVSVKKSGYRSNQMPFAIGDVDEVFEAEPNNAPGEAQAVAMPLVVNGRISEPGDVDLYTVQGRKGETLSVEVVARRLNSPLDSLLILSGPGIEVPVRNDDHVSKDSAHLHLGAGLVTHHADSYLLHTLPETGTYQIRVSDTQAKGGVDYGYRLRISRSNPDFKLVMEPSGFHIAPGGTAAFTVRASRLDGFDGEINLMAKNLPAGFEMSDAVIPAGAESTRFTITAPRQIDSNMISPKVNGWAVIDGQRVSHRATPVDDQMQAFLYRHLVPAQELVLAPVEEPVPLVFEIKLPKSGVVELPLGEEVRLAVKGQVLQGGTGKCELRLDHPPEGYSLSKGVLGRAKARKAVNKKGKKKKKSEKVVRVEKGAVDGHIILVAEEPLKPGDESSLVVVAVVKRGKEESRFMAPAIPVRVVKAR